MARPLWRHRAKVLVQSGRSVRLGVERLEDRTLLAAGDLDPTFGTGGKVTTDFAGVTNAQALAVVIQPDSRIVVGGSGADSSHLVRYLPDGSLDPAFGTNGQVIYVAGFGRAMALQADGKIVVAGKARVGASDVAFVLGRFNPDGRPDVTFGGTGSITTHFGPDTQAVPKTLVLQADGRIVAAGNLSNGRVALARYNPDGSLDTTFGSDGKTTIRLGQAPLTLSSAVNSLLLQADGKIVVVGTNWNGQFGNLALARLLPNGSADVTFTSSEQAIEPSVIGPHLRPLGGTIGGSALLPDGRIVVATTATLLSTFNPMRPLNVGGGIILFRFEASGRLDSIFGTGGKATADLRNTGESANAVAAANDGRIVVVGRGFSGQGGGDFLVIRYLANGSLDTGFGSSGFGTGGWVTTDFRRSTDEAQAVALQADGKLVVVGGHTVDLQGWRGFAVARYFTVSNPNERLVAQVYRDLLRRQADPGGLEVWTGLLDRGAPRAEVVQRIQASAEYHGLVVRDLYSSVLVRPADPDGLPVWVNFLNQGGTAEQLRAILYGSDEYYVRRAGATNAGFVQALYLHTLLRLPEPAGAQGWGEQLAAGVPRATVAAGVLASREYDGRTVQTLYFSFLRRNADPVGHDVFIGLLQRGFADEVVVAAVIGSDEYFSRL